MLQRLTARRYFAHITVLCFLVGLGVGVVRHEHDLLSLGKGYVLADHSVSLGGAVTNVAVDCHVGSDIGITVEVREYRSGHGSAGVHLYKSRDIEIPHGVAGNKKARVEITCRGKSIRIRETCENRILYTYNLKGATPRAIEHQFRQAEWRLEPGGMASITVFSLVDADAQMPGGSTRVEILLSFTRCKGSQGITDERHHGEGSMQQENEP